MASNIALVNIASKIEDTHVDGATLTVQGPHNIRGAHSLTLAHFNHSANVAKKVLQEKLQVEPRLLVDVGRDALDAAAASEAADGGFGDALDVVAKDFSGEWWWY